MPKALGQYGERNAMHALGSMAPETGYVGFKTWTHTRHGAGTIFSLFDAERGTVLAVIAAAVLSQLRTAAISGVATRWMAREDADTMALIDRHRVVQGKGVSERVDLGVRRHIKRKRD